MPCAPVQALALPLLTTQPATLLPLLAKIAWHTVHRRGTDIVERKHPSCAAGRVRDEQRQVEPRVASFPNVAADSRDLVAGAVCNAAWSFNELNC